MAWGWLQSFSGRNITGAGTTTTATPGANLTSGSTLIAVAGTSFGTTSTTSSVTDASSNSFVKIASSGYTNGQETSLWALNTPAGDAGTKPVFTATCSASGAILTLLVVEFSGIVTGATLAALVDGTPKSLTGSTNTATGNTSYASSVSNELLIMGYADDGGPLTWVVPSGATNDNNGGTANGWNTDSTIDTELAFKNSTGGAETDGWGLSGTATGWGIISAAFKLAAGAPPPLRVAPLQAPLQPAQPAQPPRGQVVSAPVAYRPVVTLSGTGTLTAVPGVGGQPQLITSIAQPPLPAQRPAGRIVALSTPAFTSAAILSGSGTLAAAWTLIITGGPVIQAAAPTPQPPSPAPSQITGAGPSVTFTVGATLSGAGTLSTGPGVGGLPVVIQSPTPQPAVVQPPVPPPGRVISAQPPQLGAATLSGSGTLTAAPFFSAAAALSGSGTLTAAYTTAGASPYVIVAVIQPAQPPPPPSGRLFGVPPPPPPPVLQSATIAATVTEGTTMTVTVAPDATSAGTVSEQASITASVT